ncbi:hypothetical protein MtrunA17_Chr3g0094011 [Medicago truncatula]|uniref:Nodule-specific Glycine Rich Peptide n=1 Tax=Medicago truncatula TaxID=3880 RepID=I3S5I4_MEDTR|nr:protein argonaute 2 isoform X2 [Medicago truncatula]AFK35526.1 unknown [Medicago truncatula]KEH16471.1 Nodule-specific Glycine Rich Peptide [Medicago truncatula]RHN66682.1 hypothetical protein MtrunA17_Chr3g0094011 [Medicago truncatula]
MKTKPLIFVFFVCSLIIITVVAIDSSKVGETENSQANFGVERVEGGHNGDHEGGNVDGFLGKVINWLEDRGILGEGRKREARRKGRGRNEAGLGGGTEYSSGRGQNYGRGGGGGGNEEVWEGGVHKGEENEEPGLG